MKCKYIHNGCELYFSDIFAIGDGTEMLSRNVGKKMPTDTAKKKQKMEDMMYTAAGVCSLAQSWYDSC